MGAAGLGIGGPIVPPLAIAMLVWPAFCGGSMLLYGNAQIDHSGTAWLETIAFSLTCGLFVSWTPLIYESICVQLDA